MPGISGEEVLDRIREGPHDPWVAMVTAVDPDFDIVDMPFDEYLSKPVDRSELRGVVDRLLRTEDYDRQLNDLYAVTSKIAALQAEKTNAELEDDERYAELLDFRETLREGTDELLDAFDEGDFDRFSGLLTDGDDSGHDSP
jgi:DNA-binding response OmpR family regulator